jgi:hypothetical protein
MQKRLRASKIAYKREFLREIVAEVRVFKNKTGGTLKYKILLPAKEPGNRLEKLFFTLSRMVVAVGLEPTTSRM